MMSEFRYNEIFLIDDIEIDNFVAKRMIEISKLASVVTIFNNIEDAVLCVSTRIDESIKLPEIIILDLRLPVMGGFVFLNYWGSLSPTLTYKSKIVVLSSSLNEDEIALAKNHPCVSSFQEKPLSLEVLSKF